MCTPDALNHGPFFDPRWESSSHSIVATSLTPRSWIDSPLRRAEDARDHVPPSQQSVPTNRLRTEMAEAGVACALRLDAERFTSQ